MRIVLTMKSTENDLKEIDEVVILDTAIDLHRQMAKRRVASL